LLTLLPFSYGVLRKAKTRLVISSYFKERRWRVLKRLHTDYINKGNASVFFGNSITENFRYFLHESDSIVNMGISGDFTEGLLKRAYCVTDFKPAQVFIMIGINDIVEQVPLKEIENNYTQLINYIRVHSPNTRIFIQSTLPTCNLNGWLRSSDDINEDVMALNRFLKATAEKRRLTFINLFPDYADENNSLKEELSTDGVHLNSRGYAIWKKHISPFISI
jgi:lysophospholipase L1-like esterase